MNLIDHFHQIHTQKHGQLAAAMRQMSAVLGNTYDSSRLLQWKRGERLVPSRVQEYMRPIVFREIWAKHRGKRVSDHLFREICDACDLPSVKEHHNQD